MATQNTDIAVPAVGKATPYPSELGVEGGDGRITDINVQLSLSATFGEDLDIALVSPSGNAEVLMSDVCGGAIAGITLTLDSQSGSSLPSIGPCSSGTFKPTNGAGTDTWEGGPSVESALLTSFTNEDPNGNWELFVVDDLEPGGGSATITSWSVTITTETAEIVIPGSGKGSPYPSTKSFDLPPGKVIGDLNLNFFNYSHMWPEDVDALLTGPRRGATVLAMSDACGDENDAIHNFQWVFDDEAIPSMGSTEASCFPVNVKPSNLGGGDVLPAPAPGPPYGSAMSAFDGLEGGQFQLFVNDSASPDTGYLTKWDLTIATRDAADTGFTVGSTRVEEGGKAALQVKRSGPTDLGPATINVSVSGGASSGADFTAPDGTLEFARGQASKSIEVPIASDKVGEPTERLNVVLSSPRDDARLAGTTSTEVVIGPDNEFKFGKLKKNAKKGTAKLFVNLPGPGTITTRSKGVKRVEKTFKKGGSVAILLKPKGKALTQLNDEGSAKVALKVTFTPVDGSALTTTRKAKLILND